MQTLQIDKAKAKKLYKNAAPEFKELLHETFGEKFFNEKITDRVKTFEDAYEIVGIRPQDITCTNDTKDELAYKKLKIIAQALNEGWTPDWSNSNERKWFPWFEYKSGFGFSCTDYDYWYAYTDVGSRLCFKSEELAEYAANQFQSIYNDFLTL